MSDPPAQFILNTFTDYHLTPEMVETVGNNNNGVQPAAPAPNMYASIINMAFLIGVTQAIKLFNLTDAKYLFITRIAFATTQALLLATIFFISSRINAISCKDKVEIIEPPVAFSGKPSSKKILTVAEYDQMELMKMARSMAFQVIISLVVHHFFKSAHILIMNSIMPIKTLLTSPLFKLYLLRHEAKGGLSRPFQEPSAPLVELLKQFEEPAPRPIASATRSPHLANLSDSSDDEHPLLSKRASDGELEEKIKILESDEDEKSDDAVIRKRTGKQ